VKCSTAPISANCQVSLFLIELLNLLLEVLGSDAALEFHGGREEVGLDAEHLWTQVHFLDLLQPVELVGDSELFHGLHNQVVDARALTD